MNRLGGVRTGNILAAFLEYKQLDDLRRGRGLNLQQLNRWEALRKELNAELGCRPPDGGAAPERRRSLRVPTRLRCSFDSLGSFRERWVSNISRGGLFIRTPEPLPLGTKLLLRIELEDGHDPIDVECQVVSNNVGLELARKELGMGVRFTPRGHRTLRAVEALYERELERALAEADTLGQVHGA